MLKETKIYDLKNYFLLNGSSLPKKLLGSSATIPI
uniref:Uncharacterized protein n=1 Tax=Rhizophora mucronata TaxID=61149 RepID=A0A2P2NC33_RHIMU